MYKIGNQKEFAVWLGELKLGLCDNIGGGKGGREVKDEGDTCIPMADSCGCVAEANTTLWRNFPSTKTKLRKTVESHSNKDH